MENKRPLLRVNVRTLVEFLHRSGDLDRRHRTQDPEVMLKGANLHRKLQRMAGSSYRAEFSLSLITGFDLFSLKVEGRADGIFTEKGIRLTWVDEIKGTYQRLERLKEPVKVHLSQALCYAYIYARAKKQRRMGVQLTYVELDTEKIKRFRHVYTYRELKVWYKALLEDYGRWLGFQMRWRRQRDKSIRGLSFPFPYREGQRQLVSGVYHAMKTGQNLFACAPTGIGKTMSTVYPAVRALGEGYGEMIFYLTAKTITRTVAQEAFSLLWERGLSFKVLVLTAREKLCPNRKVGACNPEECAFARGHFDHINEAVYFLLTHYSAYDRDLFLSCAQQYQVCPFELSLDLALWVDGVICDYNYCFDPDAGLKRFFSDSTPGRYLFLVDEAHNLVDRARDMYSASLSPQELKRARELALEEGFEGLAAALKRARDLFPVSSPDQEEWVEGLFCPRLVSQKLTLALQAVQEETEILLSDREVEVGEELLSLYFLFRHFNQIQEVAGDDYLIYLEAEEEHLRFHLSCMDPSQNLSGPLSKGRSSIFFSATLLPLSFYRRMLSIREDDFGLVLSSPFPRENKLLLIATDVTTRYTLRGAQQYERLAGYLARVVGKRKGNYLAFFPSYQMLDEVYSAYMLAFNLPGVRTIRQDPGMREWEREEFLRSFDQQEGTLLGFAIMGGIFSEGIDFLGERLIGAFVVGTGLPMMGTSREALRYYYDLRHEDGFAYAYRYPGMNKVFQAAGRVIRTSTDQGVILLLDQRFGQGENRETFPADWSGVSYTSLHKVGEQVEAFWREKEKKV